MFDYDIVFNVYSDGLSGHANVTFRSYDGILDSMRVFVSKVCL